VHSFVVSERKERFDQLLKTNGIWRKKFVGGATLVGNLSDRELQELLRLDPKRWRRKKPWPNEKLF
jgi:hypothetical protein